MTGLQNCALQLLFHVVGYAQAHYLVKNLAEVFSVCEADFIGDVLHRYLPFVQKLHCFPNPVFPDKPRKGSSDVPGKVAAQLERAHGAQTQNTPPGRIPGRVIIQIVLIIRGTLMESYTIIS